MFWNVPYSYNSPEEASSRYSHLEMRKQAWRGKAVVLRVLTLDQKQEHHMGRFQKCKIRSYRRSAKSETLGGVSAISVFSSPSDDVVIYLKFRTTTVTHLVIGDTRGEPGWASLLWNLNFKSGLYKWPSVTGNPFCFKSLFLSKLDYIW